MVRFTENFGTAFKTRVAAQTTAAGAGQGNGTSPPQNVPGTIYNSESNFIVPVSGGTAGLADYGTRLKAVFNDIPAGAHIFVSTANVFNNNLAVTVPAFPGGSGGNTGTVGYAQLVTSETASDAGNALGSFLPLVTATDNGPNNGNVPIAEIPITNGTGTAVWEVVNTNPNTNETFGVRRLHHLHLGGIDQFAGGGHIDSDPQLRPDPAGHHCAADHGPGCFE